MSLKEKITQIVEMQLELAKKNRERIPYSQTDAFANAVLLIGPTFEVACLPGLWRNEEEKYRFMGAVRKTAEASLSMAVVLITDTRWVEGDKIAPLLGIPTVEELGVEEWQTRYRRAVTEKFKGYVGNMPAEWYSEAVMVIAKGPGFGTIARSARYEKGPNDSIKWLSENWTEMGVHHFNLLPDWWC
jgi:hypothetical protein